MLSISFEGSMKSYSTGKEILLERDSRYNGRDSNLRYPKLYHHRTCPVPVVMKPVRTKLSDRIRCSMMLV
jgi:hypothetical protein